MKKTLSNIILNIKKEKLEIKNYNDINHIIMNITRKLTEKIKYKWIKLKKRDIMVFFF